MCSRPSPQVPKQELQQEHMAPDRYHPAGGRITYLDTQLDVNNRSPSCLMLQLDVRQLAQEPLLDKLPKPLLPVDFNDSKLPHL